MSESKHTIPVDGRAEAAEEQQTSAARAAGAPEPSGADGAGADRRAEAATGDSGAAGAAGGEGNGDGAGKGDDAGNGDDAAQLQGDLDELGKLAAKRDEYLALAQRTQADFENYRKRVARESALAQERGVAKLAKELLPAIDNLERAIVEIAMSTGKTDEDPLLGGVRLVLSELTGALARVGIESFSPDGQQFDPALHEAMSSVPQPPEGGAASGTVVEVFQRGYRLGESVIRPARVVVAA
jgi:molecular chaperone GrpE